MTTTRQAGAQGHMRAFSRPISALQAYQRVLRQGSKILDIYELTVVLHLVDRTLGWQKTRVSVGIDRMINGSDLWAPLPMSRRKLLYVLRSLEDKGAIARRAGGFRGANEYSVNFGWLAAGATDAWGGRTQCTRQVHDMHPIERRLGKEKRKKEDYPGSPEARPVPSVIEKGRERAERFSAVTRSRANAAEPFASNTAAGIEDAWQIALREAFPGSIHKRWSVREKAQVKAQVQGWLHADEISFADFTDWAVRNWSAIIAKQFRWMTKSPPPTVPSIGFFLSFMGQFAECWGEGKLEEWLRAPERTDMEKLLAAGLSHDEATAEIGRRRAQEGMKQENERIRVEARSRLRRAEAAEKRAELIGEMPIHPQSKAAQRIRQAELTPPASGSGDASEIDWANVTLDPNWEPPAETLPHQASSVSALTPNPDARRSTTRIVGFR